MTSTPVTPIQVPAHVPRELYWDHDLHEFPGQFADPYIDACAAMHQGPDIVWAVRGAHARRPGWLFTRVAHMQEVFMNPAQFPASFNRNVSDLLGTDLALLPFESDPPVHRVYRALIQPWFQPSAINALEQRVRQICDDLMKKFAAGSSCEFMSEFGSLLPSYIFLELMGMPRELLPQFLEWENTFLRGETVQARINAVREVYDYLQRYTAEKRQNPGDDLVSKVVAGKIDGRKITETEILGLCMTLYLGGLDTVANSLGWHLRHLARDQALQKRLKANPELIPAAVDELLRAYGVTSTNRTVAEDMEFHGVPMRRGDVVGMPAFFACRDPREYPDPHVVNLERKQRNVTFGTGIHNCIGIHLAKREIRIVLTEFLSRFENIRIPEGSNEILTTEGVWGVKELPLVWDRV